MAKKTKKADRAKPHGTVLVTRELLESLDACENGLRNVLPLLPARISTDPEENIDLALALCGMEFGCLAEGLAGAAQNGDFGAALDDEFYEEDYDAPYEYYRNQNVDALLCMQWLAWAADALLTKEGK